MHLQRDLASQAYDPNFPSSVVLTPNSSYNFTWGEIEADVRLKDTLLRYKRAGLVKMVDQNGSTVTSTQLVSTATALDKEVLAVSYTDVNAGDTTAQTIGIVQRRGVIDAVRLVPAATIAASGTAYNILTLLNGGSDGTGTTAIGTLNMTGGVTEFTASAFTLSSTASNLEVNPGDVLRITKTKFLAGMQTSGKVVISNLAIS